MVYKTLYCLLSHFLLTKPCDKHMIISTLQFGKLRLEERKHCIHVTLQGWLEPRSADLLQVLIYHSASGINLQEIQDDPDMS